MIIEGRIKPLATDDETESQQMIALGENVRLPDEEVLVEQPETRTPIGAAHE